MFVEYSSGIRTGNKRRLAGFRVSSNRASPEHTSSIQVCLLPPDSNKPRLAVLCSARSLTLLRTAGVAD